MRATLAFFCFFLCLSFLTAQYTIKKSVYFDTDEHQLTHSSQTALHQLSNELESLPGLTVEIQAHTDDRGSEDYNFRLAERRARSVKAFLLKRGLIVENTTVSSLGELQPSFDNAEEEGRQGNRRVDVILNYKGVNNFDELFGLIKNDQIQTYEIDPTKPTQVVGQQGTIVWIEANTFVSADGSLPEGPVQIQMKEAYQEADMILSDLMTSSGGNLLETGGMISLEAISGGEKLKLQAGQELIVGMPTQMQREGMELFLGETDENGQLSDWQATNQGYETDVTAYLKFPPRPKAPNAIYHYPKFKLDLSGEPIAPTRPKAPYKPFKPKRENVKYDPGFVKRLLMGKKKIEEKEDAIFAEKMTKYEERMKKYHRKMIRYEQEEKRYQKKNTEYKRAHKAWERGLSRQYDNHEESEAYKKQMEIYRAVYERKMKVYKEKLAKWRQEKDRILEEFETKYDQVGNMSAQTLNNYLFRVNELGWINCDRFYNIPESEKMELAINDPDQEEERVFIVFKEIDSILRPGKRNQQYISSRIPKSADVKIVGIKIKDGRPQLAVKETKVDALASDYTLEFKTCSLKEMRSTLTALN